MYISAFVEIEFFLLIICSLVFPVIVYGYLMWKNSLSRTTVLIFGLLLIGIAGANIFLLQRLSNIAKSSLSVADNQWFASEISLALYLLPALFAGVGINIISHLLINHLEKAEKKFDREHH